MVPSLAAHRTEIATLCQRFHVLRLDVFGSAARGTDFDPARSDVDFIVEYEPQHGAPDIGEFLGLRDALSSLLGRNVDLLTTRHVRNPYLRASIERSREPIYAA